MIEARDELIRQVDLEDHVRMAYRRMLQEVEQRYVEENVAENIPDQRDRVGARHWQEDRDLRDTQDRELARMNDRREVHENGQLPTINFTLGWARR